MDQTTDEFLIQCRDLMNIINDTMSIYYPKGINSAIMVSVCSMIIVQICVDLGISEDDAIKILRKQYKCFNEINNLMK